MPLDPGNPYYRAELIPPSIAAMEQPLCTAYGVGLGNFGAKGNENHLSGYHRSRNWILHSPDSTHGARDYSIQLAVDKQGNGDDVCAFDFTPGSWGTPDNRAKMKTLTRRVIEACQRHDPRVAELREVAGTLDGSHVVTYDQSRNAFKSPFDSSHLEHIHGSFLRGMARQSHAGLLAVMLDTTEEATEMPKLIVKFTDNSSVFLTDFTTSRAIGSTDELGQLFAFAHSGDLVLSTRNNGDAVASFGPEWKAAILGVLTGEVPAGFEQYAQPTAAANVDASAVAAAIVADPAMAQLVYDRAFAAAQAAEDS